MIKAPQKHIINTNTGRKGGTNFDVLGLASERRVEISNGVGGDAVSIYEAIMIMLTFGLVVIAIMSDRDDKK